MVSGGKQKVLVTGSSGLIGAMLIGALGNRYDLSGLDIARPDGAPDVPTTVADVSDYEAMSKAFDGVDAVVHLAANPATTTPWPDVLRNNISATHNVYEAARQHGVKRVVFASSNHAVGNFEMDEPYKSIVAGDYEGLEAGEYPIVTNTVPIRPDSDYGVSKAFGEAVGRYYHEHFGLEVACLRIGTVNRQNNPLGSVRHYATWLSHRDLAALVNGCLSRPIGFEIFYGVSNNKWRFWDISHARQVVGYDPQDNAEDWREEE